MIINRNLEKLGPFRVRDKKSIREARIRLFKEMWKIRDIKFIVTHIFIYFYMYVICYETSNQAKEAWFVYKRSIQNKKLLERHKRLWNLKAEPAIITILDSWF